MKTVDLFYKSFCILKIKDALISCRWSKVRSKAGENNGLIRPPAESVAGLDNREIAPISSPHQWNWGRTSNYSGFPVWEFTGSKLHLIARSVFLVGATQRRLNYHRRGVNKPHCVDAWSLSFGMAHRRITNPKSLVLLSDVYIFLKFANPNQLCKSVIIARRKHVLPKYLPLISQFWPL